MDLPDKFLKPYDHTQTEDNLYRKWEESGYLNPDNSPESDKTFSIVLPPPNVTGTLHIGHALGLSIEDIMVRYHRMKGFKTLWVPGTDHASIATQTKVEKELSKKGIRRQDLSREEFISHIEEFAQNSHDTIANQVRKMGASVDWSREAYTLDDKRSLAVRTAFKKMYDDGLIYQGDRIINWDPKGQTTISDDEIVYQEEKTKFYYFKYGPFTIGTARPETKFGDKYVVMHPDDTRYKEYAHGQKINLEWINGPMEATVIKDENIDMEFGTGVMTITPWHSTVDFEMAERHGLDKEQIIDQYGKLLPIAGEFAGMKISEAREKIVEKLREKGLLVKEEDYTHNIATAERTGATIEPQIMKQWFVAVNKPFRMGESHIEGITTGQEITLKQLMRHVVEKGLVSIHPLNRYERVYYSWIDNLKDWNISRQIVFGHRIPIWYKGDELYCGVEAPTEDGWEQDPDTLDTWFSSGTWTFSTLGWPEKTKDLEMYHPTSMLETGHDIIFFWVARMILMSTYCIGQIPFENIYFHGLVRDKQGRKMSKSLGNIVDPLDIIKEYSTDALRMSLIVGNGPGNDLNFSDDKVRAYKKFTNKLWNISRFILENIDSLDIKKPEALTQDDQNYLDEFETFAKDVDTDMKNYRYYLASEKLYAYIWHTFADIIIEAKKKALAEGGSDSQSAQYMLLTIFKKSCALLHPFMPFITEEIWQSIKTVSDKDLIVHTWPIAE